MKKPLATRVVNLEDGHPTVNVGLLRLDRAIAEAARDHVAVLKLIHGYGSKGVGGRLKHEVARALENYRKTGRIAAFITGENFRKSDETTWELLKRAPELKDDRDLSMNNRGISIVLF